MKNQKGNPNQIKPNELRIGNWVSHEDYSTDMFKVKDIYCNCGEDYYVVNTIGGKNDEWLNHIDLIAPIPLTEELLLKCGFEPIPHFTVVNSYTIGLGRGRVLSIGDTENANQMAWIQSVDGSTVTDLICVHNFDYEGKMHIHQLQNLYFALTGEELKIEL